MSMELTTPRPVFGSFRVIDPEAFNEFQAIVGGYLRPPKKIKPRHNFTNVRECCGKCVKNIKPIMIKTALRERMIEEIIQTVARAFGVTPECMTGKIRTWSIAGARHVAMYAIRNRFPKYPLRYIGEMFCRDHTCVVNSCKAVKRMMDSRQIEDPMVLLFPGWVGA
jgi:Bacterial dnaA protein helix-turn-helix